MSTLTIIIIIKRIDGLWKMKGQYIEAVIPDYHKLGGLKKKNTAILFSHSSRGQKSKIKVLAEPCSL